MYEKIQETASWLKQRMTTSPKTAIILGTGLGQLASEITDSYEFPYSEIPNFPVSTVEGHAGKLIFGKLGNVDIMAMEGRFHYYEGYNMKEVTFPIRIMYELGIKTLFVSNAPGGMNPEFKIGDSAHSGNKEKYLSEGFAGCLYKPFSEEDLLAAVSQMDRLDITAIMEGEEYVEEMLDIFIEDTTEELSGMRDAFFMRNYVKLGSIIHKAAPLWEMIRINIPRSELKGMASMPPEKWGGISDERIEKLIEAVEQAVEKAKKIKEKTYGNRIGSGR